MPSPAASSGLGALLQGTFRLSFRVGGPLALGLLAACGSDVVTSVPQPQAGTISVTLTPASMTLSPGGTSGAGVTVTRDGASSAPVALSASSVPTGVTLTFNPANIAIGVQGSLTVTASASAAAGTSEISIVGTSGTTMSPPAKLTLRIQ